MVPRSLPKSPQLVRRDSPRVEAHERADRFVFLHECANGTKRTTVLPVGSSSWHWDEKAGTVWPSIHCEGCGTHGFWRDGRWTPA